ncbi:ESCRT II complex subunit Dot2 [Tieghemiomyces parasiticus]|uniref:ESCRT II complex subunit Dot2 n=1 Tax=Tieghemiomyces parasiticus TaxID=78921 RepID=A0A9W8DX61_9FUNG|nr:ESCRT II complex subunit Dot2 [Tieghemiomyces parasiticus]
MQPAPSAANKGFWADLLGFGDFYYELGIQVIEACISTRHANGGLITMEDLCKHVEAMRGRNAQEINEDDIIQAIRCLVPLGSGFQVTEIGTKKLVRSIPREFNTDQAQVLSLAQDASYVTVDVIADKAGWTGERITSVLEMMLRDGLCWIDTQGPETRYYFPTYFFAGLSLV